jgi:hypothetical protein
MRASRNPAQHRMWAMCDIPVSGSRSWPSREGHEVTNLRLTRRTRGRAATAGPGLRTTLSPYQRRRERSVHNASWKFESNEE